MSSAWKKVVVVVLLVIAAVAPGRAGQQAGEELGKNLDEYLSRLEKFGFSGVVLVAKDGHVVLAKGYGFADRARRIRYTAETIAPIGSVTKQFTAAAVLKMEMMGRLRVEDSIAKYLPGVPEDKRSVTLHHLLTHTSGIGRVPGGDDDPIERDDLVRQALALPLRFQPGERFEYSNEGYSLAAAIVEHSSKKSYEEFLRENLFQLAAMHSTGYVLPPWNREQMAHGYNQMGRDTGTFESVNWGPTGPGWHLKGNGGILSTPGDMLRWHQALLGESILSAAAKEKLFKPYVPTDAGDSYGYGWGILTTPRGTKLVAHNGGNGIFFTEFRRYLDEGLVIFAQSNGDIRATELGANQIPAFVFEGGLPLPPTVVDIEEGKLNRLAGEYKTVAGDEVRVSVQGGRLNVASASKRLLAVLSGLTPPGGLRSARFEEASRRLLEEAARGNFQPIFEAFGGQIPLERVKEMEGGVWRQLRRDYGEFTGVEVLGTSRGGPGARVVLRLNFERGSTLLAHGWQGNELAGINMMRQVPGTVFFPVSETEFVRYSLREPRPMTIRFRTTDGKTELLLPTESGELAATKTT